MQAFQYLLTKFLIILHPNWSTKEQGLLRLAHMAD